MKNINSFLRLAGLILLLTALTENSFAGNSPDKIKGKAVYADDLTPVRGGTIEVVSTNTPLIGTIVLEKVTINSDGTFLISRNCLNQTDDIKIMAYKILHPYQGRKPSPVGFSGGLHAGRETHQAQTQVAAAVAREEAEAVGTAREAATVIPGAAAQHAPDLGLFGILAVSIG